MSSISTFINIKENCVSDLVEHIVEHEEVYTHRRYQPEENPIFMEPKLIRASFDAERFNENVIFELMRRISKDAEKAMSSLFRVYIEGKLSPKDEHEFIFSSRNECESIEAYFLRLAGNRKFGVIINGAEQWSDELSRFAQQTFSPVIHKMGYDCSTIEVTLFIGNYGYTPFGIHVDDPYTQVVHFHLGPSNKSLTLFEPKLFHQFNGPSKNCYDPDAMIEMGNTFNIQPGDIFVLPPHYYHVGNTESFSIGIAIAISKYPKSHVTKNVMRTAITEKIYDKPISDAISSDEFECLSFSEWLSFHYEKYCFIQKSRGGLRYAYQADRSEEINHDTILEMDKDFRVLLHEKKDNLFVFARGNHIKVRNHPAVKQLFQILHEISTPFTIHHLNECVLDQISQSDIQYFIDLLYSFGVIHLRESHEY
ncbi:cupin domain-containing protein [Photobacterium galatheae]|uniref:JmjC domain-containing protein n=1 Tax=Photobacterium galatheae TaxID=1654360 RepID=A0A066RUS0_9GAMM|nr:cupin domain-containing protein [Photobacterium galatheae]KDM91123.1 hypothetical protein EA58_13310 [Photobacterium galatheae]MCM0150155.1 hypothetical protein [Photobacterium galatheae]